METGLDSPQQENFSLEEDARVSSHTKSVPHGRWKFFAIAVVLLFIALLAAQSAIFRTHKRDQAPVLVLGELPVRISGIITSVDADTRKIIVEERLDWFRKRQVIGVITSGTGLSRSLKINENISDTKPITFSEITVGTKVTIVRQPVDAVKDQKEFELIMVTVEE